MAPIPLDGERAGRRMRETHCRPRATRPLRSRRRSGRLGVGFILVMVTCTLCFLAWELHCCVSLSVSESRRRHSVRFQKNVCPLILTLS